MSSRLFGLAAAVSLALCLAVCAFWVRGRSGYDAVVWNYYRWLPDGSAAGTTFGLTSDSKLRMSIGWGQVGPFNGQLVWGYYVNADASGGRPRLEFHHERYDPESLFYHFKQRESLPGWGPVRWYYATRSAQRDGDDSVDLTVGVSHWLAAALLAILPAWAAWRWRCRFSLASLIVCVATVCVLLALLAPLLR